MNEIVMLALVEIVLSARPGQIDCKPSCDVRVSEGDEIHWISDSGADFALTFEAIDVVGRGNKPDAQPFTGLSNPRVPSHAGEFKGTIRAHDKRHETRLYKYTIEMSGEKLDPIVVIDD